MWVGKSMVAVKYFGGSIVFWGFFTQNWPKTCDFRDLSTKSPSLQWGT